MGCRRTEGLKAGQGTLEVSVTLGAQHATFQQASNQTDFLPHFHRESAKRAHTLMAENVRMISVFPMTLPAECPLLTDCGNYRRPIFKYMENISISKQLGTNVITELYMIPNAWNLTATLTVDWPDVFKGKYDFQMIKLGKLGKLGKARACTMLSITLCFSFEDDTDTAARSGGGLL